MSVSAEIIFINNASKTALILKKKVTTFQTWRRGVQKVQDKIRMYRLHNFYPNENSKRSYFMSKYKHNI